MIWIEETLYGALVWVVFEPNDADRHQQWRRDRFRCGRTPALRKTRDLRLGHVDLAVGHLGLRDRAGAKTVSSPLCPPYGWSERRAGQRGGSVGDGAHGFVSRRELLRRISTECTTPGRAAVPDGSALSELYAATDFRVLGAVNAHAPA